ncbi:MAG: hypothetical protein ABSF86_04170 [Steroidobacteraceae bacterium]|jgi:hypothetical protein
MTLSAPAMVALACAVTFSANAWAQDCAPEQKAYFRVIEQLVDLSSSGGSEIEWMHDELKLTRDACSRGKDVEAVWRLEQVQQRIKNVLAQFPERTSPPATRRVGGRSTAAKSS